MKRVHIATALCVSLLAAGMAAAVAQQNNPTLRPGDAGTADQNTELPNLPNPYQTIRDFVTMPDGRKMGSTNAINVDSKGDIWVFERCGANSCVGSTVDPILEFDPSGKLIRSFGAGDFVYPHG